MKALILSVFVYALSSAGHAYEVSCDCYGCVGENCSKLSELKELSICRGPSDYCGAQLGYFRIGKVKVSSNSKNYAEVIQLLVSECAKTEAAEHFAVEERTCIQTF